MTIERYILDAVRYGEQLSDGYKKRLQIMGRLLYYDIDNNNEIQNHTFIYDRSIIYHMVSKSILSHSADFYYNDIINVMHNIPPQVFIDIYKHIRGDGVIRHNPSKTELLIRKLIKIDNISIDK